MKIKNQRRYIPHPILKDWEYLQAKINNKWHFIGSRNKVTGETK